MLTCTKVVIFPLGKNILHKKMLLQRSKMVQRLLFLSHCKNCSSVQQFKESTSETNQDLQVAKSEETLPRLPQTKQTALQEHIKFIPPKIRHLQDARLLYSSLFPKLYAKAPCFKIDLRDNHILLVKDKMKEKAADAVVKEEYKINAHLEYLEPTSEEVKACFPYSQHEIALTSTNKATLKYFEKHRIDYKTLPEVDRKKELSALLREYDLKPSKPLLKLPKITKKILLLKQTALEKEASELQENQCNPKEAPEESQSHEKLRKADTCLISSDTPSQGEPTISSQVPSTNLKLQGPQVCSKCNVLLDVPATSNSAVNLYTEEREPALSDEPQSQLCQRCHFDDVHSATSRVIVPADSYLDVLRPMSTRFSLVLVVVDIMEAPFSIHSDIMDVIGRGQPVIVVANKVDLLPLDAKQSLRNMWHNLNQLVKDSRLCSANLIDTVLVSARSGYGISELCTLLQEQWRDNGDVFLVGSAGCGKTSLLKALADSISAHDHLSLARRVKEYNWPLTNLGLLKFEMKPVHGELRFLERGKLVERTVRPLKHLPRPVAFRPTIPACPEGSEPSLFASQEAPAKLQGPPGEVASNEMSSSEPVSGAETLTHDGTEQQQQQQRKVGAWLYDTPSAVMPMQILDLLTEEEIELVTPRTKLTPQTFRLGRGRSLLLAGLARIDVLYLHHPMPRDIGWLPLDNAKLTVYAAKTVPRTLVRTVEASSVYRDHLGDEVLMVPRGSPERLSQWPALAPQNFTVNGPNDGTAAADIVLPSLGFVSVWLHPLTVCSLRVWTPGGRGAFVRPQSLLPYAIYLKGPKQRKGLVYDDHEPFEENKSALDPTTPPSPDTMYDLDPKSPYVRIRDRLGYQSKRFF